MSRGAALGGVPPYTVLNAWTSVLCLNLLWSSCGRVVTHPVHVAAMAGKRVANGYVESRAEAVDEAVEESTLEAFALIANIDKAWCRAAPPSTFTVATNCWGTSPKAFTVFHFVIGHLPTGQQLASTASCPVSRPRLLERCA